MSSDDGVDAGQQLASGMRDLYAAAELKLITAVRDALKSGYTPAGLVFRFEAFRKLRTITATVVDELAHDGGDLARQIVERARKLGQAQAYREIIDVAHVTPDQLARITAAVPGAQAATAIQMDLLHSPPPPPVIPRPAVEEPPLPRRVAAAAPPATPASERIEADLIRSVRSTDFRILRWTSDAYQRATALGAQSLVLGQATPLEAQTAVWDRLSSEGITGFIDTTGRGWDLTTYVEMATRTAAQRAWNEQHTDEYNQAGIDLVMVSVGHDACRLCRPWQGVILSTGDVPANSSVDIAGSVDDARLGGLQHNNCRCSYTPYIDGFTEPQQVKASPQASDERDQLRYLERGVRDWKRREAAALTEQQMKAAQAKVRDWQTRIRQHVATTSQTRKPAREQIR